MARTRSSKCSTDHPRSIAPPHTLLLRVLASWRTDSFACISICLSSEQRGNDSLSAIHAVIVYAYNSKRRHVGVILCCGLPTTLRLKFFRYPYLIKCLFASLSIPPTWRCVYDNDVSDVTAPHAHRTKVSYDPRIFL